MEKNWFCLYTYLLNLVLLSHKKFHTRQEKKQQA